MAFIIYFDNTGINKKHKKTLKSETNTNKKSEQNFQSNPKIVTRNVTININLSQSVRDENKSDIC
uniref:Uncharacterized protein n=1 Tax=Tetranychus urticae TaxID=32264 RepID=T1KKD4_TETUR